MPRSTSSSPSPLPSPSRTPSPSTTRTTFSRGMSQGSRDVGPGRGGGGDAVQGGRAGQLQASLRAHAPGKVMCFVLLVLSATVVTSSETECNLEFTSLALLSCQETSPHAPTPSCCDALLYIVDVYPSVNQGICCLCRYLLRKGLQFDLDTSYVSCHGKDTTSVALWMQQRPAGSLLNCNAECRSGLDGGDDAPPLPPKKDNNMLGTVMAIFFSVIAGAVLIGYILYCVFSSHEKKRESPNPSTKEQEDSGGGVEMTPRRIPSMRISTSRIVNGFKRPSSPS